jgi:hypothetical protein
MGLASISASFVAAIAALFVWHSTHAQPPPNADPALSPWFQSLQQPGTGVSCCSISDCRPTEFRTQGDLYEVLIAPGTFDVTDEKWLTVPPDKVLQRTDNPVGRAVVCWRPSRGIMCFIRGTET